MMKPVLDARKCPAQQIMCKPIQVCAAGAITYVADENLPLGGRTAIDYARCNGCGECVPACCGHCIEMHET